MIKTNAQMNELKIRSLCYLLCTCIYKKEAQRNHSPSIPFELFDEECRLPFDFLLACPGLEPALPPPGGLTGPMCACK